MEPTLSQIKEYLRENDIDIFEANIKSEENEISILFENNNEEYFQYYMNHSVEITDWLIHKSELL